MGFQTTGTASEYFAVDASKVTPIPEDMSHMKLGDIFSKFCNLTRNLMSLCYRIFSDWHIRVLRSVIILARKKTT